MTRVYAWSWQRKGYPGKYNKGTAIGNLDAAAKVPGVTIFHAGTQQEGNRLLSNGGRVLNIVALGQDVAEAQRRAYQAIDLIDWPEGFCRRDIGWRAIKSAKI
jgi:phosphoribosylamine--glycine ligase